MDRDVVLNRDGSQDERMVVDGAVASNRHSWSDARVREYATAVAKSVGVDPNSSDIGRFSGATCKVERARFHIDATCKVERAPARRGRRDQLIWAIHVSLAPLCTSAKTPKSRSP